MYMYTFCETSLTYDMLPTSTELLSLLLATLLTINTIERKQVLEQSCHLAHLLICRSVCLLVGLSVWCVNCGKMADWIWMPFGVMSGVG